MQAQINQVMTSKKIKRTTSLFFSAHQIKSNQIKSNQVKSSQIKSSQVKSK